MAGFAGPRQLQRLLDAVITIGSDLELSAMLHRIVEAATELAGAKYGALGILDPSRTTLSEFLTVGVDDGERDAIGDLPVGKGLLGVLIDDPQPLRIPDLREHPLSGGFPPGHPAMTSFLGVPVLIRGEAFGNLYLCDKLDGDPFTDIDEELVTALAAAAGVAVDNARLHERVAGIVLAEDRDRIARDLHDTVIQRLFALGLRLQSVGHLVDQPAVAQRLDDAVEELDITIKEIRSTIFDLHVARIGGSTRHAVIDLVREMAPALGFEPTVRFDGPVDAMISDQLAEHLLAVAREALSNILRHAHASKVEMLLSANHQTVTLEVHDDGVGISKPPAAGGHGINNMAARVGVLKGKFVVEPGIDGGTTLRWSVPLG